MDFKYGDLIIKCYQCGSVQLVEELIDQGRCIYLFNQDDSSLKLHCPECDTTMEMRIVPNEKANAEFAEDIVEIASDEELQEESPAEETV
jgi:uncharacterized Zn finger protein